MTTRKQIPAPAAPQAPVKPEAAKPVSAKPAGKKPTLKKPSPPKPAPKKSTATKAPNSKTAVKKALVKAPLSKTVKASPTKKATKAIKIEKAKKPRLVRDSFTIPKPEYLVLDALKQRAAKLTRPVKKSELLRAGIKALAALSDAEFLMALEQVPAIKTGRPALKK